MGKTTLLKHIADRKLAIPPNIDVLLCEQEVMADDTPAIEAVLKADTKRLHLLEEEAKLIAESEAGNDGGSERLKQVREGGVVRAEQPNLTTPASCVPERERESCPEYLIFIRRGHCFTTIYSLGS